MFRAAPVAASADYLAGEGKSQAPVFHFRRLSQVQWEPPRVNVTELVATKASARGSLGGGQQGCWQGTLGLEGAPTTS